MAFERGFKTWANKLADETRQELGLKPLDRLDPRKLAESLLIPVVDLSSMRPDAPSVGHLLKVEPEAFSAVTVFHGTRRMIIHNDGHAPRRQNSNIAHELSHGLLGHPPIPAFDEIGCRLWDKEIEEEARWLSGCLLIGEPAALAIARGKWSIPGAAEHFGVSEQMVNYRINASGARQRAARVKAARR